MKRPTRPFIVEVKKKRGGPVKQRSIWGDLDLSVIIDDTLAVTALISERPGNDPDPAVEVDRASGTGLAIETPSEDGDAHAIADANHAEPHPTAADMEGVADEPARSPQNVSDAEVNERCPMGSAGNVGCQRSFVGDLAGFLTHGSLLQAEQHGGRSDADAMADRNKTAGSLS